MGRRRRSKEIGIDLGKVSWQYNTTLLFGVVNIFGKLSMWNDAIVVWDLNDDEDGNVQHVAEHGLTIDEVEDVLLNEDNTVVRSHSSGFPLTFGWMSTGQYIGVIWEVVNDDPRMNRVRTAYPTSPPKRR